jgi:hypothetical protein
MYLLVWVVDIFRLYPTAARPFAAELCAGVLNPGREHIIVFKRLIRYLKRTADYGLKLDFSKRSVKTGFYGFCVYTCKRTLAYLFYLAGCPTSWHSKLHSLVTTSTNPSEYYAAVKASLEGAFRHTKAYLVMIALLLPYRSTRSAIIRTLVHVTPATLKRHFDIKPRSSARYAISPRPLSMDSATLRYFFKPAVLGLSHAVRHLHQAAGSGGLHPAQKQNDGSLSLRLASPKGAFWARAKVLLASLEGAFWHTYAHIV